jgi:uncharacterized membrane protein required for colicin V production
MLVIFSLLVIAGVALAQYRNGLFTSVAMTIQVMLAGLIAFELWEPVADELDTYLADGRLAGYEDCIALVGLFALSLFGMRLITNRLNKMMIDFNPIVQQVGGPAAGVVTGYLVSGFLVCVFQTLPVDENFMGFTPRAEKESPLRRYMPADRVWLALMRRAGAYPLSWDEDNPNESENLKRYVTFDRDGTFEIRYARFRRHSDKRTPPTLRYEGEFESELSRKK